MRQHKMGESTMAKADVPPGKEEDRRLRLINRTMRMHGSEPHALIETLHTVQESFGYLDMEHLKVRGPRTQSTSE